MQTEFTHGLTLQKGPSRFGTGLLLCVALLALVSAPAFGADKIGTLAAKVNAARKARQYAAMETDLDQLLKLWPGYPQGTYLLAIARAGRGDAGGAYAALGQLADMGLYFDIGKPVDLAKLRGTTAFESLERRFKANLKPIGHAEPAFRLKEKTFLPEGIAYEPGNGDFFVSSVHLRKIVRVHHGKITTFADRGSGVWGVFGLRVDAKRGVLWAASAALPQAQDFDSRQVGRTTLFRFDLQTGRLLAKYVPTDGGKHQFNDLAVAPDGTVYVADGNGGVYVRASGAKALTSLIPAGKLRSSQGLALSADGRYLYVADYVSGLYAYDLKTNKLIRVRAPADVCVYGIDGMVRHGRDLVVTENGVQPQRVVNFRLDRTGLAIESAYVVEANQPLVPEPTLLTVVGKNLYVVANSQWSHFDIQGRLKNAAALQVPLIVKLGLY